MDASDPSVRILYIVNWVLVRLESRNIQIEIKVARRRSHEEEKPSGIFSYFLQEFIHRYEFSAALGHLDNLFASYKPHCLDDDDLKHIFRITQSHNTCFEPVYVAVMIRP